jgi:hypothetical protein
MCSKPARIQQAAGIEQLAESFRTPGGIAAERHGDIDDVPPGFPQQPQRQPADDAFIVRMR